MSIQRFSEGFLEKVMSEEYPAPEYVCPSCGEKGFAFEHDPKKGSAKNTVEVCRVCGLPSYLRMYSTGWKISWQENGAKRVFDMPLSERVEYINKIEDCRYRKEFVIPSEDDVRNRRLDRRIFTDNQRKLEFVTDDSKLTITNDKGEKWEFPYETNRFFELDNDKRYVMLIEEHGYARLLASDYLAVRESVRLCYPGLTRDVFGFVGVFDPDCVFEDKSGTVYTATVRKGKGEFVFEDDEFHKKVVSLSGRIKDFIDTLPANDRIRRGVHTGLIYELENMDRHGDPIRYMPKNLNRVLDKEKSLSPNKRYISTELFKELTEMVEEYKALKRV